MWWLGRQIGPGQRFRVIKQLGTTPLVTTYAAVDQQRDAPIVLKVLADNLARDWSLIERLEACVQHQAELEIPGLVNFRGHFRRGDSLAFYRDLIEGRSLTELLAEAERARTGNGTAAVAWSRGQVMDVLDAVLRIVGRLHGATFHHFGLSPSNIFVVSPEDDDEPLVRITDLQLAHILGQSDYGRDHGDERFLAPEQRRTGAVDARVDVYAAGVLVDTLFSRLAGRATWASATADGHESLGDVIQKATAWERENRFDNVGELREALLATGVGEPASTPTAKHRIPGFDRGGSSGGRGEGAPGGLGPSEAEVTRPLPPQGSPLETWDHPATVPLSPDRSEQTMPLDGPPVAPAPAILEPSGSAPAAAMLRPLAAATQVEESARKAGHTRGRSAARDAGAGAPVAAETVAPLRPEARRRPSSLRSSSAQPPAHRTIQGPPRPSVEADVEGPRLSGPRDADKLSDEALNAPTVTRMPALTGPLLAAAAQLHGRGLDELETRAERMAAAQLRRFEGGKTVPAADEARVTPVHLTTVASASEPEPIGESAIATSLSMPRLATPAPESFRRWTLAASVVFCALGIIALVVWAVGQSSAESAEPEGSVAVRPAGRDAATPGQAPVGESPNRQVRPPEPDEHRAASAAARLVTNGDPGVRAPAQATPHVISVEPPGGVEPAESESAPRFEPSLWQVGNTWVLRHSIDPADPGVATDYFIRRRITETSPHAWGTRVTLIEEGGPQPPRTRDFVAATACLIEADTERTLYCLPTRPEVVEERTVADTELAAFRVATGDREIVFDPSYGWIEELSTDDRGQLVTNRLVGYRIGDRSAGELDRPVYSCHWDQVVESGRGIGRNDDGTPVRPELAQLQRWGLEGRIRRVDLTLGTAGDPAVLHTWYTRHGSVYQMWRASWEQERLPETPPERVELPFERAFRWSPPEGAVDVVALQFGRDGADLVQLVTLSDEGQPDIRALLPRTPEGPEVTRVALVPRPTGCGLQVSRWRGERRVALETFDLPGQAAQASNE